MFVAALVLTVFAASRAAVCSFLQCVWSALQSSTRCLLWLQFITLEHIL